MSMLLQIHLTLFSISGKSHIAIKKATMSKPQSKEEKLKCHICNKQFANSNYVKVHNTYEKCTL